MYQGSVAGFWPEGRLRRTPVQQVALMRLKLVSSCQKEKEEERKRKWLHSVLLDP